MTAPTARPVAGHARARLIATDTAILAAAATITHQVTATVNGSTALLLALTITWLAALAARRAYDTRILGFGPTEYRRVYSASWRVAVAVAAALFATGSVDLRDHVAVMFTLGTVTLIAGRAGWREWLHRHRREGRLAARTLVIGSPHKADILAAEMARHPSYGFTVAGVCLPPGVRRDGHADNHLIPIVGEFDDAAKLAVTEGYDYVTIAGGDTITPDVVRRLTWDLEGSGVGVTMSVALNDVHPDRLLLHPVGGLPLMYVDEPAFTGRKYAVKSVTDWVTGAAITAMLAPVLAVIAVAVKATSPGPVLFRQERIGRDGNPFHMYKFRSMVDGADRRVAELLNQSDTDGVLFKMKDDPRVTRVGAFLRKHSLDELPQLFNVLRGDMSLVGPRPHLPREVAEYDTSALRRLRVKPGMTGLWQVSGRSNLTWDESVRLDVYYAENWTPFGDLSILARTAKTVLFPEGAY